MMSEFNEMLYIYSIKTIIRYYAPMLLTMHLLYHHIYEEKTPYFNYFEIPVETKSGFNAAN